jgi:DNA invertase Pin-like site-specific DNA recombinase
MRVLGYARVSTERQADEGVSLAAQETAIRQWAMSHGHRFDIVVEQASAKDLERPKLRAALEGLEVGEYGALVVARLDRLSRSVADFAGILEQASEQGWSVVCLDPNVDMTTPYGRALAGMAAVFAQLERELISQRTREAVAAQKAAGTYTGGRPSKITEQAREAISDLAQVGMSSGRIAEVLNASNMPSPTGQGWKGRTIRKLVAQMNEEQAA